MPTNSGLFYAGGSGRDTYINCNNGGTHKSWHQLKEGAGAGPGSLTHGLDNLPAATGEKYKDKGNYNLRTYSVIEPAQKNPAYTRTDVTTTMQRRKQKDSDARLAQPKFQRASVSDLTGMLTERTRPATTSPYGIPRSSYGEVFPVASGAMDGPAASRGGSLTERGLYPPAGYHRGTHYTAVPGTPPSSGVEGYHSKAWR